MIHYWFRDKSLEWYLTEAIYRFSDVSPIYRRNEISQESFNISLIYRSECVEKMNDISPIYRKNKAR